MLETPRLRLREWRGGDAEPFWAMCQDAEVMRYFPPVDRAGADALIARQIAAQAAHGHCFWAAERREDGAFVGIIGLGPVRAPLREIEVGWRLARTFWHQGYASEGGAAALKWGWRHLPVPAIVAITVHDNAPSRAVMRRIGMAHAAAEDFDHPNFAAGDRLRRHVLYRALRPGGGAAHA